MFSCQLLRKPLRKPLSSLHSPIAPRMRTPHRHFTSFTETTNRARIDRVLNRLPKFLHPYTNGLRNAPIPHIIAFLLLHEITAIVPLVGLAGFFHYSLWLPKGWSEGKWVNEGVDRFGRYFHRKGWFGFSITDHPSLKHGPSDVVIDGDETAIKQAEKKWNVGEKGSRILVEVATAYAITKIFLPARVVLSVWGTPWFARIFVGRVWGLFARGKGVKSVGNGIRESGSGAAGTGATGGGAIGKAGKSPSETKARLRDLL